jgi:hypothetical protein
MIHKTKSFLSHRWKKVSRRSRWIMGVVVGLLVITRLALPFAVKSYVNHQLRKNSSYSGTIGDVDIGLWRGAYRIHDIQIFKKTGGVKVPFFAAPEMDLSIQWKELFHGAVVGEVVMSRPKVNFVSGPTPDQTQTGENVAWDQMLKSLFPFKLNRLEIRQGQIHFQNEHSTPPVDIYLNGLAAVATNFTNTRNLKQELPAGVTARGTTIGGGGLNLQLRINPLAPAPTYELVCEVTNVDLVALNDFLKAYGKFDVERGVFGLYTSVASKDGSYEGEIKVLFENLDVFAWEKERKKNVLEIFWQAVVGTLTTAFKNQSKDRLATKIPIAGSYENKQVGVWSAAATLLQNAFIRALLPKVDRQMTVEEVKEKKAKRKDPESSRAHPPPDATTLLKP